MRKISFQQAITVFLLLLASFFVGRATTSIKIGHESDQEVRQDSGSYTYTNPLLSCELAEGRINVELPSAKKDVQRLMGAAVSKGEITAAAVYFRDLNDGWWFGINEREHFKPSSLLKLPLTMAYYKLAETDPGILSRKLQFKGLDPSAQGFAQQIPPQERLTVGGTYTVSDLIDRMLKYSDNDSAYLLGTSVPKKQISATYTDLHLEDPFSEDSDGLVSVREFGTFFRVLFNSSYLTRSFSEQILSQLTRTTYKDGLVAGVPEEVAVAHKFGEGKDTAGVSELHDCGIIYAAKKPYFLCVMTKGSNMTNLGKFVQDVSETVYNQVAKAVAHEERKK